MQTIQIEHLHTLHFEKLYYSIESLITLLNTCRKTIQKVQLYEDRTRSIGCTNTTTVASALKIENLNLHTVYKLNYTMLNILGNLSNLQNARISLVLGDCLDDDELLMTSDDTCLNLDLCSVLKLLHKARNLTVAVFELVISSGNQMPSHLLKKKLVEQQ